ncbi:MAG: PqqD family protein [Rubrobacter sp.]|nr:PqqD family protein [Rubrobacter sp.]
MRTNQIYELNQTGARFWELLSAGHDRAEIQRIMLQEFDVVEADLTAEIDTMLASLKSEGLITS